MTTRIVVTFFNDYFAQTKTEESMTVSALADLIRTTSAPEKESLPLLKLARFGNARSAQGSLRYNSNVITVTGVEADYDGEHIAFFEAIEIIEKAGIEAIVYTSRSHTDSAPRWRVLCPFSRELSPDRRQLMMGRLNGLFRGVFAVESWTLSQAYYFGAVNSNPASRVELVEGIPIDLCHELDTIWLGKPDTKTALGNGNGQYHSGPVDEAAQFAAIASGQAYHMPCTRLVGSWAHHGVSRSEAEKRLDEAFDRVEAFRRDDRWEARRADVSRIVCDIYRKQADQQGANATIDPSAPFNVARLFLVSNFTIEGRRTLHRHRSVLYEWNGTAYPEVDEDYLRARLYRFLDQCTTGQARVRPTAAMVSNVLDAVRAASHLHASVEAPAWLDPVSNLPPEEIIACTNTLLHLPTATPLELNPSFFIHHALGFAYEPDAPEPRTWLTFLSQLWPEDQQSIDTLQEIFGLGLTGETKHQKAFLIVGPKRSGKGTIARVLTRLVGVDNTVAPTLASLGTNFGLAPLMGKLLAVVSDARLGGKADRQAIAERLLSITGEDAITIDRKYRDAWTGRLQARFVILSNELPRLPASSAMASRFIVLLLVNSFYGHEDLALFDRLLGELPGILNWSITGWRRLAERGHFVQPRSALDAVRQLEDLGSPIGAFIREECEVGPGYTVETNRLFQAWKGWCEQAGHEHPGTVQTFGRDLRAALPWLKVNQSRDGDDRLRYYQGLRPK